jgi:hypothetical protein
MAYLVGGCRLLYPIGYKSARYLRRHHDSYLIGYEMTLARCDLRHSYPIGNV